MNDLQPRKLHLDFFGLWIRICQTNTCCSTLYLVLLFPPRTKLQMCSAVHLVPSFLNIQWTVFFCCSYASLISVWWPKCKWELNLSHYSLLIWSKALWGNGKTTSDFSGFGFKPLFCYVIIYLLWSQFCTHIQRKHPLTPVGGLLVQQCRI